MNGTKQLTMILPQIEHLIREQVESLSPEATLYELEAMAWRRQTIMKKP